MKLLFTLFFLFLSTNSYLSAALPYKNYIDEENGCTFPIFEGWSYQKGEGNTRVITESEQGYKISLDIYQNQQSFIEELSENQIENLLERIKRVVPDLSQEFSYSHHEIIQESHDGTDESFHIQLFWSCPRQHEKLVIQDLFCNQGRWYLITFDLPSRQGNLDEIADLYLQTTVEVFLTDFDMRTLTRMCNGLIKLYESLHLPCPQVINYLEWPLAETRANSITL